MKSMMSIIVGILVLGNMIGCEKNNANALESLQKEQLTFLETVEMHQAEIDSEKVENTIETESTPVFSKDETIAYETYTSLVNVDTLNSDVPLLDEQGKKYALQLACVTDLERLIKEQKKLREEGYETTISKRFNRNTAYYRLRLNGKYTQKEAKQLGKEIVRKFLNIKDYLVLQVR